MAIRQTRRAAREAVLDLFEANQAEGADCTPWVAGVIEAAGLIAAFHARARPPGLELANAAARFATSFHQGLAAHHHAVRLAREQETD